MHQMLKVCSLDRPSAVHLCQGLGKCTSMAGPLVLSAGRDRRSHSSRNLTTPLITRFAMGLFRNSTHGSLNGRKEAKGGIFIHVLVRVDGPSQRHPHAVFRLLSWETVFGLFLLDPLSYPWYSAGTAGPIGGTRPSGHCCVAGRKKRQQLGLLVAC